MARACASDEEFEALAGAGSGAAAFVDFGAAWCAPCKAIAPHFAALDRSCSRPRSLWRSSRLSAYPCSNARAVSMACLGVSAR